MIGEVELGKVKVVGIVGIFIGVVGFCNFVCGFIYVVFGGKDGFGLWVGFLVSLIFII